MTFPLPTPEVPATEFFFLNTRCFLALVGSKCNDTNNIPLWQQERHRRHGWAVSLGGQRQLLRGWYDRQLPRTDSPKKVFTLQTRKCPDYWGPENDDETSTHATRKLRVSLFVKISFLAIPALKRFNGLFTVQRYYVMLMVELVVTA